MELTIAVVISILNCVLGVVTFAMNRKKEAVDKVEKDGSEKTNSKSEQVLIEYRLTKVEEKLDKILDILDSYDKEIDARVDKAMEEHIKIYHREA